MFLVLWAAQLLARYKPCFPVGLSLASAAPGLSDLRHVLGLVGSFFLPGVGQEEPRLGGGLASGEGLPGGGEAAQREGRGRAPHLPPAILLQDSNARHSSSSSQGQGQGQVLRRQKPRGFVCVDVLRLSEPLS